MATMAFNSPYEEAEAARPPISLHPAFPAIVALWFAALLGLGSLVLPVVLLEKAVSASGLASLVPAAAPPLGITARGAIALAAALIGAGLGVAIARRVAGAHRPEPVSRIAQLAGSARRPISVHEELGGERVVNGESLPINRRRALAISEDDRPSDFLYRAPLPGDDPDAPAPFAAAPFVETPADDDFAGDDPADEPLELSELAEEAAPSFAEPATEPEQQADEADEDDEMSDSPEFNNAWPSHQHYPPEPANGDERDARNNLAGPRGIEPLPFSAPSLARRAPAPEPELEPETEFEPAADIQLEPVAPPADDEPAYRADWQTAPLEGLGLVQLVQRLGSTIERRREWIAQAPVPAPAEPSAPASFVQADFEPAAAEEAVQAMAAFFCTAPDSEAPEVAPGEPAPEAEPAKRPFDAAPAEDEPEPSAMPRPGFLRPLAVEDEDDEGGDDALPDFSLPLRRPAARVSFSLPQNDAEPSEADDEAEQESEDSYSSLLGLGNPFAAPKNEFVRIEEPEEADELAEPAVVFPGQEDAAPAAGNRLFDPPGKGAAPAAPAAPASPDADAALRAALATLQRMSGAA